MYDFEILTTNTPVVRARKKNDSIALIKGKPQIYHKSFDITEFIGEELTNIRGVESVCYFPICFGNYKRILSCENDYKKIKNIRVGSYDFLKKDYKYYNKVGYIPDSWEIWLEKCIDDNNRESFINEHLEMYALDTYMGQYDRLYNTIYEVRANSELHLSKLFDYEAALYLEDDGKLPNYITSFHKFSTIDDYHKLISKYPQFEGMLRAYCTVNLVEIINQMCVNRGFDQRFLDFDRYKRFDDSSHKKLELILK